MNTFQNLIHDEDGATAIEYGLIAALVSVAVITILGALGDNLVTTFTSVSDGLGVAADDAGAGGG